MDVDDAGRDPFAAGVHAHRIGRNLEPVADRDDAAVAHQHVGSIQPLYAALVGGLCMGMGFLVLFRHHCSLGGIGILALYLQGRFGWRAGAVQMAADFCIVAAALVTVEPMRVLWSVIGAVALNQVLAINHRPGRYMAA